MASCIDQDGAFTWADVDATSRDDFLRTCFADWDDTSRLLTAFEQQEATRVCLETSDALDAQADRCALLQSLYAP